MIQRSDAVGSTRVAWLYDETTADWLAREQSLVERAGLRGASNLHNRQLLNWFHTKRDERLARMREFAAFDPGLVPAWSPGLPEGLYGSMFPIGPSMAREARGWPCRALWMDLRVRVSDDLLTSMPSRQTGEPSGGCFPFSLASRASLLDPVALPLRIAWRGFVIDTLIFAALWLGATTVWRRWRVRRLRAALRMD
jgi:hypothetical protein